MLPAPPSATDLAVGEILEGFRRRDLSAREVVAEHIARIEAVNPALNAVVIPRFDRALDEARAVDAATAAGHPQGPLAGLPVTVKECFSIVGLPTTAGVVSLPLPKSVHDAVVVASLRQAGAVVLGKTNLAQLSWSLETENPVYGLTNNPWDLSRTPGGSSGGEAAIVAARGSPLGIGTDSGGSVRIPAHFCGIHGFKPTSQRLSDAGTVDEVTFSFQDLVKNQPGLFARGVEDLRIVYAVLAASCRRRHERESVMPVSPHDVLRVGYYVGDGVSAPDENIGDTVLQAARALESAGALVEEFCPPRVPEAVNIFNKTFTIDAGSMLRRLLGDSPRDWRTQQVLDHMPPAPLCEPKLEDLRAQAESVRRDFTSAFDAQHLDAVICPSAPVPAPPHGALSRLPQAGNYAVLYNLLGWPSGVVAARVVEVGMPRAAAFRSGANGPGTVKLPVGVQVAAKPWREDVVFSVMLRIETTFACGASYPLRPPV